MKYINFIVGAIAWVPYFVPIVIEGNKRGIQSYFFIRQNPKEYADPYFGDHINQVQKVATKYNIIIQDIKNVINYPGLTFLMEGDISGRSPNDYITAGIYKLNKTHLKVSFTYNADFIWQYHRYIKHVDYVVFPGKSYDTTYQKLSPKNLYLGSPKFDIKLDKDAIYKKYNLKPHKKYLLFFYPKTKWINISAQFSRNHIEKIKYIVQILRKMGYNIIIKSREKDRVEQIMGDHYFEETELYPISSLELLQISDLAVFFSSACIEECVMMSTPFIDFKVDHKFDRFAFLHHPNYSRIITNLGISKEKLEKEISNITGDNKEIFKEMQETHMVLNNNIASNILDHFEPEADERYDKAVQLYSEIKTLKEKQKELAKKKNDKVNKVLNKIKNNNTRK